MNASNDSFDARLEPTGATQRHIWMLETLHAVNSFVVGIDDTEAALQRIAEEVFARFRFTSVAIGVISGDTIAFRGIATGVPPFTFSMPLTTGICGRVARNGQGELIEKVSLDPDYVVANFPVEREIAVPIFVDGILFAVLNVEAMGDVPLGHAEFDVMVRFAQSLGLAIERSRRTIAEARRLGQFTALQRLSGRIAGRIQTAAEFTDILSEIDAVLDFAGTSMGIIEDDEVVFYSSYDDNTNLDELLIRVPIWQGVVGRVIRTGETAVVPNVEVDTDYVRNLRDATQEICVPLRAGKEIIGVLNVEQDNRRPIDGTDVNIVQTLADHIGLALANRRRIEALERRNLQLQTVERVTTIIASKLLVREALPEILQEVEAAFGSGSAAICEILGNRIVPLQTRQRLTGANTPDVDNGVSVDDGILGRVARTGVAAFLPEVRRDPDFRETNGNVRSEICVPIKVQGETFGLIHVETPASKPLNNGDLETLMIIANHLGMAIEKSDLYLAELRSRKAIEAIQRVSSIVASTLNPDEALRLIVELLAESFRYPVVSFRLLEDNLLVGVASTGTDFETRPLAIRVGDGVVGRVAATGQAAFVEDVTQEPAYLQVRPDVTTEVAVPIYSGGELTGVLNIEGTAERPLTEADLELMKTFAEHAGTLLNNARMYERMEHLASSDPITGLPNYREFQKRLDDELRRAERYGRPLSVVVIDLDRFKQINDDFGHQAGDEVLRAIGRRINGVLRKSDMLARYAGDEFVVILPESDLIAAQTTTQRLQHAVTSEPFIVQGFPPRSVVLSAGIATYPDDGADPGRLIKLADDAMYAQKAATRRSLLRPIGGKDDRRHDDTSSSSAGRV